MASVVGAVSRVQYFLFPSLYSPWLHTGDAFSARLLPGDPARARCARSPPTSRGWRRPRVADERRRIARDLHDGLSQEIAFVAGGLRSRASDRPLGRAEVGAAARGGRPCAARSRARPWWRCRRPRTSRSAPRSAALASALALRSGLAVALHVRARHRRGAADPRRAARDHARGGDERGPPQRRASRWWSC